MNKTYCVYKHTCLINDKVYIGITSQKPESRWGCEGQRYCHNAHFTNAIKKYGWVNFAHEVLYDGLTLDEARQKEIELISLFRSNEREFGYNKSSGGDPGKGVHCTEERKAKIRACRLGIKCSEETKHKISEALKNRSPELIQKFASARCGMPPWNIGITGQASHSYGVEFSAERRRHISEATKGKPKKGMNKEILDTQTGIVYRTAKEASDAIGLHQTTIRYHCTKQGSTLHRFQYVERGN